MNTRQLLRTLAVWALFIVAGTIAGAQLCGGGPGVFNVFEKGKIAINQDLNYQNSSGTCNVSFSGSNWVNVDATNLYGPVPANANAQNCPIQATGKNIDQLTLPSFPATDSSPNIKIYNYGANSGFSLDYNGVTAIYKYCQQGANERWVAQGNEAKCQKSDEIVSYGVVKFPTPGDASSSFTFTGNTFGRIETWSAPITFGGSGDIKIDYLASTNQARIDLPGGRRYFVNNIDLGDNYKLTVSGTQGAKLYINNVVKMNGNGSCINIASSSCDGNNASVDLTAQHPEKLAIYIYNGNLDLWDRTQIAASIYVANGDLKLHANSQFSFIGEAAAKNIAVTNNSGVRMRYQDTGAFNSIYPSFSGSTTGLYSAARPAVPQIASVGDFSYIPYQQDYDSATNSKNYGTLRAYALQSNGTTSSTEAWDANALMTESDRRSKIYVDVNGTAVSVDSLTAANLATLGLSDIDVSAVQNRIAKGPGEIIPSKWTGRLGKPNGTQPVIFKDIVLFSTNEGILYALDKQTGALKWGWMPGDVLSNYGSDDAYKSLLNGDIMKGQLNAVTINGVDYVLGTAMGGALHYGLQLDATSGLPSRVWYDLRTGNTSPNAEKPVLYADRVVYIVDNKLVIRPVAGGGTNTDSQPNVGGGTITTSPTVVQDGDNYTLYVGTSNGYVMSASLKPDNGTVGSFSQVGNTEANQALTYVVYSKTTEFEYLTAQSKTRVTTFKRKLSSSSGNGNKGGGGGNSNPWVKIWMTTLPSGGEITDRVTSLAGFIGIPFTMPPEDGSCTGSARLYLVPLDTAWRYYSTYYLGQTFASPYLSLGTGTALSAQATYLNGRMILQGHSGQNADPNKQGLDNPLEFVPIPPNKGPGRRGWREIVKD
jgi:hypothetical protein